jgi:hypothetical protein
MVRCRWLAQEERGRSPRFRLLESQSILSLQFDATVLEAALFPYLIKPIFTGSSVQGYSYFAALFLHHK